MSERLTIRPLFLILLIALTARNVPAQRAHDPLKISDAFAKAELLALAELEREAFTAPYGTDRTWAALNVADAQAATPQEKLISAHMKAIRDENWEEHNDGSYGPITARASKTIFARINACIRAEEEALRERSTKLPMACDDDVIYDFTPEELAAIKQESEAAKRTDLARQPRPQSALPRMDVPAIARAANGSIVSIVMADKDGKPIAQGSGFLVSKDGVIVTNYHVISEGSSAIAKLPDGAFYFVDGVLAFDKTRDVAIIKAHGENFRTLILGNSDRVQVGEEVIAIGSPRSLESTVSNGIVSGIRTAEEHGGKFLQVTAPISPGSSGGPLFNMAGEVVGITTLYLKDGENLNFAIPINDAKRLLLVKSTTIQVFPNETEAVEAQTHDGDEQNQSLVGLYQSERVKDTADNNAWEYLRFYSDGTVIGVFTSGTPVQMAKWFKKPYNDTGRYEIKGSTIHFSTVSPYGTVDYQGQIEGTGNVLNLDQFSHINGLQSHSTYRLVRPEDEDAASSVSVPTVRTNPSARDYYQRLFDAGGFSGNLPSYVCFGDDGQSGTFFTITAYAYDENYYNAQANLQPGPSVTSEEKQQFDIMAAIQQTAPYVTFLVKGFLESFSSEGQQFFRRGGRLLEYSIYEKGVKTNAVAYQWDGSNWFLEIPPTDPKAYTRTSRILHLSIEPHTMRYVDSATTTITVGSGETAATDTSRDGPWAGVCEKVPNPKF